MSQVQLTEDNAPAIMALTKTTNTTATTPPPRGDCLTALVVREGGRTGDSVFQGSHVAYLSRKTSPFWERVSLGAQKQLSGTWIWFEKDDKWSKFGRGALVLDVRGDRVLGYSFTNVPVAANKSGARLVILKANIEGRVRVNSAGEDELLFTTSGDTLGEVESRATFAKNSLLVGEWVVNSYRGGSSFHFEWKARKHG